MINNKYNLFTKVLIIYLIYYKDIKILYENQFLILIVFINYFLE